MPESEQPQARRPQPFWSGQITFGLVSVPVSLFSAHRSNRVSLRMIDQDGTPLSRRYFCPREGRPLESDEIVRGYEVDKDTHVVIEDEELDAIAPEKSREIDLRRFVDLREIDPVYFDHAYFMAPDRKATKAYRLLAKTMEDTQRAGIATFVMRGREHLVAIIAEQGFLRAETLRFHDELRSPADVGLPGVEGSAADQRRALEREIERLASEVCDPDELTGTRDRRLLERVQEKLRTGEDVTALPEPDDVVDEGDEDEDEPSNVIDLVTLLKERLSQDEAEGDDEEQRDAASDHAPRQSTRNRSPKKRAAARKRSTEADTEHRTRTELYRRARELDIAGRSRMNRDKLAEAVNDAEHGRSRDRRRRKKA